MYITLGDFVSTAPPPPMTSTLNKVNYGSEIPYSPISTRLITSIDPEQNIPHSVTGGKSLEVGSPFDILSTIPSILKPLTTTSTVNREMPTEPTITKPIEVKEPIKKVVSELVMFITVFDE